MLSHLFMMADFIGPVGIALVMVAVFVVLMMMIANRYMKVGPNEALIVSGMLCGPSGYKVIKGGGVFVWPFIQKTQTLSLELMTLEVHLPEVYTATGVPIIVDGVAQIKVRGQEESIRTAAEQFLSKSIAQVNNVALETVAGHLRGIVGTLTVEEIYKNRDAFAQRVQEIATDDMAKMGMTIISFTMRDIKDNTGYLDALGKPQQAQLARDNAIIDAETKRDSSIRTAEAKRDEMVRSAEANRAGQEAKFTADTKIAESQRDYEIKVASYQASVNSQRAQADLAYDLQKFKTNQLVKEEEIKVQVIERERMTEVQEKEISRREKELEATVKRPAEAERFRIQQMAEAEKYRQIAMAQAEAEAKKALGQGEAEAKKALGLSEAEAAKARGLAEADVILAKGEAEAKAMEKKAEAYRQYGEAAIVEMLVSRLPEIANAIAAPLSKMEKIVVISSGDGETSGANKITGDVIKVMSQLPPAIEALTGMDLSKLTEKISGFKKEGGAEKKG